MRVSSGDRNGRAAGAEVDGRRRKVRRCPCLSTVAQLSFAIISPALQVAVVKDGASVLPSSRHRDGRSAVPRSMAVEDGAEV